MKKGIIKIFNKCNDFLEFCSTTILKVMKPPWQELLLLQHRPRLIWHSLFIRKNEFHRSLDMDMWAMERMNKKQRAKYSANLIKRRNLAHKNDF